MKHILLILSLFASFQIGTAQEQWNDCNSTINVIPAPPYDSLFVLSAPSRAALAKGMANWTPSASSGASYLVYNAYLSQSGSSNPVVTIFTNTLGGSLTFTRDDVGTILIQSSALFTSNKTYASFTSSSDLKTTPISSSEIDLLGCCDDWYGWIEIRVYP